MGVAGMALAKDAEVAATDIWDPSVASVFGLNGASASSTDKDRYRSLLAVPVRVGNESPPWGVVCASSNRPEHFQTFDPVDEDAPAAQRVEALRALAGQVAMCVALCKANEVRPVADNNEKGRNVRGEA